MSKYNGSAGNRAWILNSLKIRLICFSLVALRYVGSQTPFLEIACSRFDRHPRYRGCGLVLCVILSLSSKQDAQYTHSVSYSPAASLPCLCPTTFQPMLQRRNRQQRRPLRLRVQAPVDRLRPLPRRELAMPSGFVSSPIRSREWYTYLCRISASATL